MESPWERPLPVSSASEADSMVLSVDSVSTDKQHKQPAVSNDPLPGVELFKLDSTSSAEQDRIRNEEVPPTRWENFKDMADWVIIEPFRTTRGKVMGCAALTLGLSAFSAAAVYDVYSHNQQRAAYDRQYTDGNPERPFDPQARELGEQIRMIAQDAQLGVKPRLGTSVSENGTDVTRTFAYDRGIVRVSDYKESRRVALDRKYKYIDQPDGTTLRIPDGFYDAPITNLESYSLYYYSDDEPYETLTVTVDTNKETNQVVSINIYKRIGEATEWYSAGNNKSLWYEKRDANNVKMKASDQDAKKFLEDTYGFFGALTSNAD